MIEHKRRAWSVPRVHAAALSGSFVSLAANAVAGLFIARELGPAGRGEVSYAFLLMSVGSTIAYFGIDYCATHLLASPGTRSTGAVRLLVRASTLSGAVTALAVVAVAAVARPSVAPLAVLVGIVGYTVSRIGSAAAYAVGEAPRASVTKAVVGVVYLAAAIAVLAMRDDASSVVPLWAAAGVAAAIGFLRATLRSVQPGPADTAAFRRFLRLGRASWQSSLAQLVTYRLDQLVVLGLLGAADLGRYSVAAFVMSLLWVVADSVGDVEHPATSQLSPEARYRRTRQVATRVTLAVAVVAVVIAALSPVVVPIVVGPGYSEVPALLALFIPGTIAITAGKVAGAALMAGGETAAIRSATLMTAGFALVTTIPVVHYGGIYGAATLASAMYIVLSWRLWRALVRTVDAPPT